MSLNEESPRGYSRTPSVHEHDIGFEWNDQHEQLVKMFEQQSSLYKQMHEQAYHYFQSWHRWLGVPCKLLLCLVGSIQFAQLSRSEDSEWSFYVTGVLAMLGLGIELGQDFLQFDQQAHRHHEASAVYDHLAWDSRIQLSYNRQQRINVRAYLRYVKQTLGDIKRTGPVIPEFIYEQLKVDIMQYVQRFVKQDLLPPPSSPPPPTEQHTIVQIESLSPPPMSRSSPPPMSRSSPPPPMSCPPQSPISSQHFSDIQDEFTEEMSKHIDRQLNKLQQFQLDRLQDGQTLVRNTNDGIMKDV